ncbi:RagB/SusD family nutrient uptake outer membrane protein [Butyricimonas synergistica]|uniref:RagB/SusD family nutrient uptake outer membrane protein n=1 Tax=Butyricimonas synergistica TaxID=544644 RepID=UPI00039EB923|nr:RagB/SusD family nutrient uptake outer membrane protein [Butyricimonas synergistica]
MKIMRAIIFILFLLKISTACSDFLKEESQDEVIVRTTADYSEFLLGSGYPQPAITYPYETLSLLDDDVEVNESRLTSDENSALLSRFPVFTWQPDVWERVQTMHESYSGSYERIMGCNAVLDGIDDAIGTQYERDRIKAEALAVRAYLYFQLVNIYGEPYNENREALGVPLKLTAGIVENGVARDRVVTVYNRMVTDLEMASSLLENYPKTRGDYRINYSSVNILLSRVYLYMERWDDAITAANRAIKTGGVLTDYTKVDASSFYFTDYEHSEVEWLYGANNRNQGMSSCMIPSSDLISRYERNDCRLLLYFSSDMRTVYKQRWNGTVRPANTLRVSEAYLNRAEAYMQKGNGMTNALADLNELRRHRIKEYTEATTTTLEEIRLERRLELCFEEHRWFDLRRYGMPAISHRYKNKSTDAWLEYTLKERDPLYTFPIPNVIIEKNSSLEQNASAYEQERTGVTVNIKNENHE